MDPKSPDRPLILIFCLMLLTALWVWSLSWSKPILDRHEFRQIQTAISTHWMKQDGFRLDYETPLFGPPWSIPMEFPVYQWSVVQLSRLTGFPLEASGRATSIFYLLATLPAVYLLAGLARLSRPGRLLVVATVLSSPVYLFYARTYLIETTALCFATWFLFAIGIGVRDLSWRWSTIAALSGTLAALAKVTTFALYCFPAAGLALWLGWPHWQSRRESASRIWGTILFGGVPLLLALGFGSWWVRRADAVKSSNPFSGFLTSSDMTVWNWGTLDQRFSLNFWQEFWTNVSQSVLGEPALAILLICLVVVGRWGRRWATAGVAGFVLGPLLFANLYFRHDYYYAANTLLLMFGAGVLLASMWTTSVLPRAVKVMLLVLFFISQLLIFYRGHGYHHRRELPQPPAMAEVIRQSVPPEDVVLIYGWDWNALIPYYAERRAIMAPGGREYELSVLDQILAKLPPRRITAMLVRRDTFNATAGFIHERATRFGLIPSPFATSPDGELYLSPELADRARQKLIGQKFLGVIFPTAHTADPVDTELKESDLASLDLAFLHPAPFRLRSKFGISNTTIAGQPALNAHAPSEITVQPPTGATRLTAEFGLAGGSYTGEEPLTDGIGVTISEIHPGNPPTILLRRLLDPAHNPADRGQQIFELTSPTTFTGQLLFQIDPGPKGSPVKDWAYWSRIEVR